jgi:hypothetical protein
MEKTDQPLSVAFWNPERVKARLDTAERYLRDARRTYGSVGVRFQPMIRVYRVSEGVSSVWRNLRGESFIVELDEPVDVWSQWEDLKRFLRAWRPMRRRTAAGEAAARQAFEMWERASRDLKP